LRLRGGAGEVVGGLGDDWGRACPPRRPTHTISMIDV